MTADLIFPLFKTPHFTLPITPRYSHSPSDKTSLPSYLLFHQPFSINSSSCSFEKHLSLQTSTSGIWSVLKSGKVLLYFFPSRADGFSQWNHNLERSTFCQHMPDIFRHFYIQLPHNTNLLLEQPVYGKRCFTQKMPM